MSTKTRLNWLIDAAIFSGALVAALSGIYFLFLPSGGYQGGRNPMYGVVILFSRTTWDDIHTWGGVVMITAAIIHFSIHWQWVKAMAKRVVCALAGRGTRMSDCGQINVAVDALMGGCCLVAALSGIYFLFAPTGGYRGGAHSSWDPGFLFSRSTWSFIHTWAGVSLIGAGAIHFALHWSWVEKVTARFVGLPGKRRAQNRTPEVSS